MATTAVLFIAIKLTYLATFEKLGRYARHFVIWDNIRSLSFDALEKNAAAYTTGPLTKNFLS